MTAKIEILVNVLIILCFILTNPSAYIASNPVMPGGFPMKDAITNIELEAYYRHRYSYIDEAGTTVIDAGKYQAVGNFSESLAPVWEIKRGWGFIDKTGKVAIEPKFEQAYGFSEGLAGIQLGGHWGIIDTTGLIVIEPQYTLVNSFSEGLAVVVKDNEVLVIDKSGQTTLSKSMKKLQLNIHENARFSEGLIDAYDCEKKKIGFMDKVGKFVINPKYAQAAPFAEGLARVSVVDGEEEKVGFIDHSGQFVIPPTFNTDGDFRRNSTDFSEGLASLSEGLRPTVLPEEKFVYIDKKGEVVLLTDFFYAGPFHRGMAMVYDAQKDKWGYIDKSGKVVIPIIYDLTNGFSEGLAVVAILPSDQP